MKKWFMNLSRGTRTTIHIILCSLFFILPSISPEDLAFPWFFLTILEIMFIVWSIEARKREEAAQKETEKTVTPSAISTAPLPNPFEDDTVYDDPFDQDQNLQEPDPFSQQIEITPAPQKEAKEPSYYHASVIKISKFATADKSSRYENMAKMEEGDFVFLKQSPVGSYIVVNESGNELGEVSESFSEKIACIFHNILYCKIENFTKSENGAFRVKITVYFEQP